MNVPASLKGSTALVTGASGFIGSHLVDALLKMDCRVHCLVRPSSNLRWLPESTVTLHRGQLDQPQGWSSALAESQYIFHCAGLTMARTRREFFQANADICRNFYEACLPFSNHIKAVIHLSSLAAVGPAHKGRPVDESTPCHPVTHYGKSKRAGELIALEYSDQLPMVILRPPVVYGEREQNFFTYLKTLKKGWAVQIGDRPRTLSLIHAHDLVSAMLTAASVPPSPNQRVFFTTDGGIYTWQEVASTASEILKVRPKTLRLPEGVLSFAALLSEGWAALRNQVALFDRQRVIDIRQSSWTASSNLFFNHYQFTPRFSLRQGLQTTLDWYQREGWL